MMAFYKSNRPKNLKLLPGPSYTLVEDPRHQQVAMVLRPSLYTYHQVQYTTLQEVFNLTRHFLRHSKYQVTNVLASDLSTAFSAAQNMHFDISPPNTPIFVHAQSSREFFNFESDSHIFLAEECLWPTRDVRDDLVSLYFHYVHPIFPIIDEYSFRAEYHEFKDDEHGFLQKIDLMLLQAVFFAAFAVSLGFLHNFSTLMIAQHVNETQLKRTPYHNVHQGQAAQFSQLKVGSKLF